MITRSTRFLVATLAAGLLATGCREPGAPQPRLRVSIQLDPIEPCVAGRCRGTVRGVVRDHEGVVVGGARVFTFVNDGTPGWIAGPAARAGADGSFQVTGEVDARPEAAMLDLAICAGAHRDAPDVWCEIARYRWN